MSGITQQLGRYTRRALFLAFLLIVLVFALFPLLWLLLTSFKNLRDAFVIPPKWFFQPTIENYYQVFHTTRIQINMLNSVIIAGSATMLALFLGAPGGYSLAQFEFRGKQQLGFFILSIRIAPPIMSLFPLYLIFNSIHIIGSKLSLIIMYIVFNLPLAVWIMQIFFRDIPRELREAAVIDGCSELGAFGRVVLPLAKSGLVATSILCLIQSWNEYLFALVLSSRSSQTLPIAITAFRTYQDTEWGPLTAAGVVVIIPMIIFGLFVQKNLVRGMTLGAVKG